MNPPSGRRILFLTKHVQAASTRYRAAAFIPLLRQAGWHVEHLPLTGGAAALLRAARAARNADVTVIFRRLLPWPWRKMLRAAARRLVLDLDDAIFLSDRGVPAGGRARRFAALARDADAVWAGNDYLAQYARAFNDHVLPLPTAIDPAKYAPPAAASGDHLDLVWIGSSATRRYLEGLLPALRLASQRAPALRLKIVADFDLPDAGVPTLPVAWSDAVEASALASAQVGLGPLPDDPWTRGKCGLKLLQYMAASLPAIAAPVGVNAELVEPGVTGFHAATPPEWVQAIETLAGDEALRRRMGQAGRHRLESRYTTAAVFAAMRDQLDALTESTGRP